MASNKNTKNKLEKYSKEILIKYLMQHMLIDFGKLDLIKSGLGLDSVDELIKRSNSLSKEFYDLVRKMHIEKDSKKLVDILEKMKKSKDELEKTDKKINKILDIS